MSRTNTNPAQAASQSQDSISGVKVKPIITTIIPTYRRPKFLRRAINSVLDQTYPHFQVCIYDNASGDETANVVAELSRKDPRVRYYCHKENIGARNNFNFGLNAVETPFFSFLSDDDILLPEFFKTAIEGLGKFPNAAFLGGATIVMTEDGMVRDASVWPSEGYYLPPEGLFRMMDNNYLIWTSVLFRKEVIAEVGGLDAEIPSVDIDFLLRIAARCPFVVSTRPGAIFSYNTCSATASSETNFLWSDWLTVIWPGWSKIIRNLTEDEQIPSHVRSRAEKMLISQLQRRLFSYGVRLIKQKNFEDAYEVQRLLRGHHQIAKANLIFFVTRCCDYVPITYYAFIFLDYVRRLSNWSNWSKRKSMQRKFGNYKRFIKVD